MCRKLIFLISFVAVLGLFNDARAVTTIWTNDEGDADWCEDGNWNNGVPGGTDNAYIDQVTAGLAVYSPNEGPVIGIGCDADLNLLYGPNPADGNTQVMDINTNGTVEMYEWNWNGGLGTAIVNISGSPTIIIDGRWGEPQDGVAIVNISGDPCIIVGEDFRGADKSGSFHINMSGGYLEVGRDLLWGDNGGGTLTVSGGTIVCGRLDLGSDRGSAPLTINMNPPGGLILVRANTVHESSTGTFFCPANASRGGVMWVYLRAGVIDCNEFLHGGEDPDNPTWTDDWRVDIEEGVLKINGDVRNEIDANVAAGQITAYYGDGTVVVELVGANTVVSALPPDPNMARDGYPPRGSINVDVNEVLHWTPGDNATSYNVYLGTSWDDVNKATYSSHPSVDLNTVDVNYSDPCGFEPLEFTTTYYWRVDANNDGEIWKGNIWNFTTESPIDDPNLWVWYKFNEPNGVIAYDSSGRNYHGALDGPTHLWDPNNGQWDGSRIFDDDGDEITVVDVPPAVTSTIDRGITISVWLKDADNDEENWVCNAGSGGPAGPHHLLVDVGGNHDHAYFRAGNDSCDVLTWNLDGRQASDIEGWHHWAFVKDEDADTMSMYFDGEEVASNTGIQDTLVNIQNKTFKIGASTWENYEFAGAMDDFRVYDYALPLKRIQSLFRGGNLGLAWKPDPYDGEKDVPYDVICSWSAGDYTVSHDVFFGTNWDDINDVNSSSYAGYPNVQYSLQDACSYDPCGLLDLDQTFYWRVDEVNGPNTWRGNIWKFRVANFITIDDFDDDTAQDPPSDDWYQIASATISLRSTQPVIGKHSMRYSYDNWFDMGPGYYSEIESISLEPNDWTGFELKLLSLWFYGKLGNAATITEQMYVFLKDNDGNDFKVKYGDDPAHEAITDVQIEDWQEWLIPLSRFSTNNINLANLDNLCIGFGIRYWGAPAGFGVVYFDNIRLYPAICDPSRRAPRAADLNNDCEVDWQDVEIMADEWLEVDVNLSPVQLPNNANLVGWWQLNNGAGSIVTDSGSYGNNGVIETIDVNVSWVAGRTGGNALKFSGGRVRVPDAENLRPLHQVSACAWIYYSDEQNAARVIVKGPDNRECYEIEVSNDDTLVFMVRDGNDPNADSYERYAAESNEVENPLDRNEWIHVAGTYDGNSVRCYINGELMDKNDDPNNEIPFLSQDTNDLTIGNMCDDTRAPFEGTIDDVRVYNYALSAEEVAHIATGGTGMFTVHSVANLYNLESLGDRAVNLRDFAELAKNWFKNTFWP